MFPSIVKCLICLSVSAFVGFQVFLDVASVCLLPLPLPVPLCIFLKISLFLSLNQQLEYLAASGAALKSWF